MADAADFANDLVERERDLLARITAQSNRMAASARDCELCGDPIPELRRQALPGCHECIDCARRIEEGLAP